MTCTFEVFENPNVSHAETAVTVWRHRLTGYTQANMSKAYRFRHARIETTSIKQKTCCYLKEATNLHALTHTWTHLDFDPVDVTPKKKNKNKIEFCSLSGQAWKETSKSTNYCRCLIAPAAPLDVRAASKRKLFPVSSAVGDKAWSWCMQSSLKKQSKGMTTEAWALRYWWLTCLNLALASFSFILPWATR